MFLGQSHDASAKSQGQTEPSLRLLCCSAPHERMDAAGKRDTRNISGNREANEAEILIGRHRVCSATTR